MRNLVISAAVATVGLFALAGCGAPDPHEAYMAHQSQLSCEVDQHVFMEGVHNLLMDDKPTHLSYFINE